MRTVKSSETALNKMSARLPAVAAELPAHTEVDGKGAQNQRLWPAWV